MSHNDRAAIGSQVTTKAAALAVFDRTEKSDT